MSDSSLNRNFLLNNFLKYLNGYKKNLTAYDLFAIAVIIMIAGHFFYYFVPDENLYRLPDRITVPVFLISVGYNSGSKFSKFLLIGAIILTGMNWIMFGKVYIDILGTFIIVRAIINPVMAFALKSNLYFWITCIFLILLFPVTEPYVEYGTLAVIMAMAGWINKNRSEVPEDIIKPSTFFMYAYLTFLGCTQFSFELTLIEFIVTGVGAAFIFYILYDFRTLLLNSIRRRPKDIIEKICSFFGHKSLEIYVVHMVVFQVILATMLVI